MTVAPPYRKKLIEVALPLESINKESSREKSIRHGHPSTLHLWWARRPLGTCRGVLFASLVDDPSSWPELFPTEVEQEVERKRIFAIIEELVKWENSNNPSVLLRAQTEIARSISRERGEPLPDDADAILRYIAEYAPPLLDPFCGGGSIPLEAQRLGLQAHASDLNPVAVLITKALIEIPPKFAGKPPVNPDARAQKTIEGKWEGTKGLAEDVMYYGKWMRDEAEKRIGHLYQKVKVTKEMAKDRPDLKQYIGKELTIIAWLWARTVKSSNPAVNTTQVPLVSSFWLSKKKGKEAWIKPIINRSTNQFEFKVMIGSPPPDYRIMVDSGTKIGRGCKFKCLISDEPIQDSYVKSEGVAGRLSSRLMAIVAEGSRERVYLSPLPEHEAFIAKINKPENISDINSPLAQEKRAIWCYLYGLTNFNDLFTSRQLTSLITFADLVHEARNRVLFDSQHSQVFPLDNIRLNDEGNGSEAYADSIATYLAFGVSRSADAWSTVASWRTGVEATRGTFARQGLPMVWDYAEANPFSNSCGNWIDNGLAWIVKVIEFLPQKTQAGRSIQLDAKAISQKNMLISSDPPYYDNIGYSDLSDFFYVWLRKMLIAIYPSIFATLLTPKKQELIAAVYRHNGNWEQATKFFEFGLGEAFARIHDSHDPNYPLTIYYAFKQAETEEDNGKSESTDNLIISTGWETMLTGLIHSSFIIKGTWPVRTERGSRSVSIGTNALATSIVLVCRPRPANAPLATRREFITTLKQELPSALKTLQQSSIAPVDLAQAAIGPGMAVFTRYSKVMESDGSPMTVRTALGLINQALDEVLAEQEGEFDSDTRWALAWFEQFGMNEGAFGIAETLSKAKNTAINALVDDGLITARAGKVKLVSRDGLSNNWDPTSDARLTIWESTQHLIRALDQKGESGAADLLKRIGIGLGESARDLAYRLYVICDRKKWSQEALGYNSLIVAWPEITKLVQSTTRIERAQRMLFGEDEGMR